MHPRHNLPPGCLPSDIDGPLEPAASASRDRYRCRLCRGLFADRDMAPHGDLCESCEWDTAALRDECHPPSPPANPFPAQG